MKILHINYSDKSGGAGIAAYRHNEAMNRIGLNSNMLVVLKMTRDNTIYVLRKNRVQFQVLDNLYNFLHSFVIRRFKPRADFCYALFGHRVDKHPLVQQADAIYLHWINASTLSIHGIERLLKTGKPIFWYMHDMYPLTGGCHHAFQCTKYETECVDCETLQHCKWGDIAQKQFRQKLKHWTKYSNLKVVTPSEWLASCARNSTLFRGHEVFVCPNVLDTDKYKPLDKKNAKELFGLNSNKKTILFGAVNVNSPYKGWEYLKECIRKLDKDKYECLVFGYVDEKPFEGLDIDVHFTSYLSDDYSMILVYNASDVFVSSSLADNYPNVIVEAMSCGVPCVGFDIGGIPDLIKHEITGYLAKYKKSSDLTKGIEWIFEDASRYHQLTLNARNFIVNHCSYGKVLTLHRELGNIQ